MCREMAIVEPGTVHTLRMPCRGRAGARRRVPYEEVTGPLAVRARNSPTRINQYGSPPVSAKRGLAVLLTALFSTTALLTALPFTASAEARARPGERTASALRSSPVYVDPAYADPPARSTGPARPADRPNRPADQGVLDPLGQGAPSRDWRSSRGRPRPGLAQRDLVLITTDGEFTDSLTGTKPPGHAHQARDAVAAVGFLDEMREAGPRSGRQGDRARRAG